MLHWKQINLGDFIITNKKSIGKDDKYTNIEYLETGSISRGKITNTIKIALENAPSRARRILEDEDIIYSSVRPINRHYGFFKKPKNNFVVSTGFITITCNKSIIYPLFLYHYLTQDSIVEQLDAIAEGSTSAYPCLLPSDIEALEVLLPPLPEQKAIAGVLGSLDDKIDLLQRQNATLEAMAETLFRERFISYSHKDSMVAIDSYILFNPKRSIRKGDMSPYLEMSNLRTDAFCPIEFYDKEFTSGSKFINGDTLLARITPCLENGKKCFVNFLEDGTVAWGSTEYVVMHPMDELHPLFAYCLVKTDDFRGYAESCLSGSSGRQRVDVTHLKQYEIKSPRKNDINDFNRFCTAIEPKLLNNYKKIKTLEKLRDTLLPKLMSGEVRVRVDG